MKEQSPNDHRLRSAGATVRHQSIFENLVSYQNKADLSPEFLKKWAGPFYMRIGSLQDQQWIAEIKAIKQEISPDITLALLGDFNWRTRLVGSYFSALKGYEDQIDVIGTHFLKSEVCFVGSTYALVFAFYNKPNTIRYINDYLNYYLQKPELFFDQDAALNALVYLDRANGTNDFEKHRSDWLKFKAYRWDLEQETALNMFNLIKEQQGKELAEAYLKGINDSAMTDHAIETRALEQQLAYLKELSEWCSI